MDSFIEVLRKIIVKCVRDKNIGSSVYPNLADQKVAKIKTIRIPKGVQKERAFAMAKLKDIANIKIEHKNEKKLRELLEERGLDKKNSKKNQKTNPIIKTNYRVPKKKEENESK